jgi:hypothetical protein
MLSSYIHKLVARWAKSYSIHKTQSGLCNEHKIYSIESMDYPDAVTFSSDYLVRIGDYKFFSTPSSSDSTRT